MRGLARYTAPMTLCTQNPLAYHREVNLADEAETVSLGQQLAQRLSAPQVIYLQGELGAGKTTFSRGFLQGRGHVGSVKSPTYTLVEPYEHLTAGPVFHLDLYRLGDPGELEYLGLEDYLSAEGILLIEWPERAAQQLPQPDLEITLALSMPAMPVATPAATPAVPGRIATVRTSSESVLEGLGGA
ncbi:MAG: tRNA (adenosine(37)-N6)-threonylcarbamoyltransferase complex ATPase subunit type 1 TsaE [Luminiphilus sp.]